jgi:hypothetical protein
MLGGETLLSAAYNWMIMKGKWILCRILKISFLDEFPARLTNGVPGTELALIQALEKIYSLITLTKEGDWFNKKLAECYFNSGNKKLEKAAQEWAYRYQMEIVKQPGFSSGPRWGESAS